MMVTGGMGFLTDQPVPSITTIKFLRKIKDIISRSVMDVKTCTKCGIEKSLSEFHKSRSTKDGLTYRCKTCKSEYGRKTRRTPRGLYSQIKARNKYYADHPFLISIDAFEEWYVNEPKFCYYCGIPEKKLGLWKKIVGGRFNRLTIDCADNDVGYVEGNLVLACDKCNVLKGDILFHNEMREIGQRYIRPKWEALQERKEE